MMMLPKVVKEAWENRSDPAVLTTVSKEGVPNSVYVGCASLFRDNLFVFADNYFDKTRKNIQNGSPGALLFIDKQGKSYQIKGSLEYHHNDEIFTHMKSVNPPQHPGHAAVALLVKAVYSGAEQFV